MKLKFICGYLLFAGIPIIFTACDNDEDPPNAIVTFEKSEEETTESDGTPVSFHPDLGNDASVGREIKVKLVFDRPLAEQAVIAYEVDGTARMDNPSGDVEVNDFAIDEEGENLTVDGNNITIEKGVSEASIIIRVFEDFVYDADDDDNPFETIILTLQSVVSGPIQLGEQVSYTLTVHEDDALIFLQWDPQDDEVEGEAGDVDMDIVVYFEDELFTWINNKDTDYEFIYIPAGFPDGKFGLSYTYYSGSSNDLEYYAIMFGSLNGESYLYPEDPLGFTGIYTAENKNTYPDLDKPVTQIRQTMTKSGLTFQVSELTEEAGSRVKPSTGIKYDRSVLRKVNSSKLLKISEYGLKRIK